MSKVCPECGIVYRDGARHMRGRRFRDASGKIIYGQRCDLQHARKADRPKGRFGKSYHVARSNQT